MLNKNEDKEFFKILSEVGKKLDDIVIYNSIYEYFYWYVKQARYYKYFYRGVSVAHMVGLASMPVFAALRSESPIFLSILAAINVFLYGILALFKPRDKWKRYRKTAELIKAEVNYFYSDSLNQDSNILDLKRRLINSITKLAIDENSKWVLEDKHQAKKGDSLCI